MARGALDAKSLHARKLGSPSDRILTLGCRRPHTFASLSPLPTFLRNVAAPPSLLQLDPRCTYARPPPSNRPGDRQNIPGFIRAYKAGKHKIMMGNNENLFDLSYIDNVVHAHLLAAEKLGTSVPSSVFDYRIKPTSASLPRRKLPTSLTTGGGSGSGVVDTEKADLLLAEEPRLPAGRNRFDQWFDLQSIPAEDKEKVEIPISGEAYFISNGEALPFWSWARAIWYAYAGHDRKMFALLPDVGLGFVTLENWWCWLVGKESAMPKAAVYYSITKRTYNIEKARRLLGYEPLVGVDEGLKRSIKVSWAGFRSMGGGLSFNWARRNDACPRHPNQYQSDTRHAPAHPSNPFLDVAHQWYKENEASIEAAATAAKKA